MIPNCTMTPGLECEVRDTLTGGLNELRLRMVRDLELFLSYALARKGEVRPAKVVSRTPDAPRDTCGERRHA